MSDDFDIMKCSLDDLGDYLHDMAAQFDSTGQFVRRKVACFDDIEMQIFAPYIRDFETTVKKASTGCCRVVTLRDTSSHETDYSFKDGHKDVYTWMTSVYLVWHGELPPRDLGKSILRAIREKEALDG